jgi:hypothetical protein
MQIHAKLLHDYLYKKYIFILFSYEPSSLHKDTLHTDKHHVYCLVTKKRGFSRHQHLSLWLEELEGQPVNKVSQELSVLLASMFQIWWFLNCNAIGLHSRFEDAYITVKCHDLNKIGIIHPNINVYKLWLQPWHHRATFPDVGMGIKMETLFPFQLVNAEDLEPASGPRGVGPGATALSRRAFGVSGQWKS